MARSRKHNDNLQRIQDVLDDKHQGKIVVGNHSIKSEEHREVGDKWTDSDGYEWEQKEGFKVKLSSTPAVGLFSKQCDDCKKACIDKLDIDTYNRMSRCYYCQINFEAKLKSKIIGEKNSKHFFWVKLKQLQRWIAMDKESESMWLEMMDKKVYDKAVSNAMANDNILKAQEEAKF